MSDESALRVGQLEITAYLLVVGFGLCWFLASAEPTAVGVILAAVKALILTVVMTIVLFGTSYSRTVVGRHV